MLSLVFWNFVPFCFMFLLWRERERERERERKRERGIEGYFECQEFSMQSLKFQLIGLLYYWMLLNAPRPPKLSVLIVFVICSLYQKLRVYILYASLDFVVLGFYLMKFKPYGLMQNYDYCLQLILDLGIVSSLIESYSYKWIQN